MKTRNSITLLPAYGRDYKTAAEAVKDWKAGLDFYALIDIRGGAYCSIRDSKEFKAMGATDVKFRFNKKADIHILPL